MQTRHDAAHVSPVVTDSVIRHKRSQRDLSTPDEEERRQQCPVSMQQHMH